MNRHLFGDHLRRNRSAIAGTAFVAAFVWLAAGSDVVSVQVAIAASLVLAYAAGPLLTFSALAPTEIQVLPISRRAIWRTGWWLSVVVAIGTTATGKVIGLETARLFGGSPTVQIGTVWLSSLLDLAQAGPLLLLLSAIRATQGPRVTRAPRGVRIALTSAVLVLVLMSMVWPFLVVRFLPLQWTELSVATAAIILAGLGVTAGVYFLTPSRMVSPDRSAIRAAWRRPSRSLAPQFSGVTGLWRLALNIWKAATINQIVLPGIIIGMSIGVEGFLDAGHTDWLSSARGFGFLPFAADAEHDNVVVLFMLGAAGLTWFSGTPEFNGSGVFRFMLRHLRTLPFSTRQLNGVLLAMPLVSWVNAWLLLALFHAIVLGQPLASWRVPEWIGMIGVDALIRAMQFRWRRPLWVAALVLPLFVADLLVIRLVPSAVSIFALAVGAIAFACAARLNHGTLTRSRLAYTPIRIDGAFARLYPLP